MSAERCLGRSLGRRQCVSIGRVLGQSEPRTRTASERQSFFPRDSVGRTESGRRSGFGWRQCGSNCVGPSVGLGSLGRAQCRDVGQDLFGGSVGQTVLGRRLGYQLETAWVYRSGPWSETAWVY